MLITSLGLLLLPFAATCGWYMGKKDALVSTQPTHKLHPDYFRGLNYLINEQPDKAVDVFVELLKVDSDTVEMHLALGNLFRRRGEVARAIRIHQNLIARTQLSKEYRIQALAALGQDYLRAGVLDRAERLFLELVELEEEKQSGFHCLLRIYEQEKDWQKAIHIARKLMSVCHESMHVNIAQYHCELAEQYMTQGYHDEEILYHLNCAESKDPHCVRASLMRAKWAYEAGYYQKAIAYCKRIKEQDPDYISEIVTPLCDCYKQLNEEDQLIEYLQACLKEYPRIGLVLTISNYLQRQYGDKTAIEFVAAQIKNQPSLRGLSHLVKLYLANSHGDAMEKLIILQNFISQWLADKPVYRCSHCGFSTKTLFWLCPGCHHWTTIKPIQGLEGS